MWNRARCAHVTVFFKSNTGTVFQHKYSGVPYLNHFEDFLTGSDSKCATGNMFLRGQQEDKVTDAEMICAG
jgi:hypothetical protein